uniref:Uncharacterized protein n=1 Tax=Leersia perrieri TaxID=77586 RepID=A0A0D9XU53_9ORYZ
MANPSARRMSAMRLSQANIDWILARSELCTDDAPDISRYIPFVSDDDLAAGELLPEIYYDEPEALLMHINSICMAKFAKFRDFQRWIRLELDRNGGLVEIEYDYDEFEEKQRAQEERRLSRADMWEKLFTDNPPEEGEFGEYETCQNDPTADDDLWNLATGCKPRIITSTSESDDVVDPVEVEILEKQGIHEESLDNICTDEIHDESDDSDGEDYEEQVDGDEEDEDEDEDNDGEENGVDSEYDDDDY